MQDFIAGVACGALVVFCLFMYVRDLKGRWP